MVSLVEREQWLQCRSAQCCEESRDESTGGYNERLELMFRDCVL